MIGEVVTSVDRFKLPLVMFGVVGLATGLGAVHAIRNSVDTTVAITGGIGNVPEVFPLKPFECHAGYDAEIRGARAAMSKTIPVGKFDVPTTYSASETYNGMLTNQVCNNTGKSITRLVNTTSGKVTIIVPEDAFSVLTFQKNPADPNSYTSDNGFLMATHKNITNNINALPGGISVQGPNKTQNQLRGWALLGAYATSSQACGKKAWQHVKPLYAGGLKEDAVNDYNTFNDGPDIALTDVTVLLPDTVSLENQYHKDLEKIQNVLENNGVKVKPLDPNKLVCTASDGVKVTGPR